MANVLDFDGVDNYVEISDDPSLDVSQITVEAWVKAESMSVYGIVIAKSDYDDICIYVERDSNNNEVHYNIRVGGSRYDFVGSSLSDGNWHHIAMTYDGETLKGFFDGSLDGSDTSPSGALDTNSSHLLLGKQDYGNENFFNGQISDIRIWDYARSQTEIQNNMNTRLTGTEAGLVSYYKLDEGTGSTAADNADNNDGTITGASWTTDSNLIFESGYSLVSTLTDASGNYSFSGLDDAEKYHITVQYDDGTKYNAKSLPYVSPSGGVISGTVEDGGTAVEGATVYCIG